MSTVAAALAKRLRPLIRPLFIDVGGDHRDTIFVAGSERSGTTWLADLLNYRRQHRLVFEPFWALRVAECRIFAPQQYLRETDPAPAHLAAASRILSGRIRNRWTDKYHRTFQARRRIVKDVRTNLMLKWLHVHFPGMPIVWILRHPCAVACSQSLARHRFAGLQEHFLSQVELVEDHLEPYMDLLERPHSAFEEKILRWCIQTYVPLRQFSPGEINVVFYESLCHRPEATLKHLFAQLGLPLDFEQLDLRLPSPVTRKDSAIVHGENPLEQWRQHVGRAQLDRAMALLARFGLDRVYDESPLPRTTAAFPAAGRDIERHARGSALQVT